MSSLFLFICGYRYLSDFRGIGSSSWLSFKDTSLNLLNVNHWILFKSPIWVKQPSPTFGPASTSFPACWLRQPQPYESAYVLILALVFQLEHHANADFRRQYVTVHLTASLPSTWEIWIVGLCTWVVDEVCADIVKLKHEHILLEYLVWVKQKSKNIIVEKAFVFKWTYS